MFELNSIEFNWFEAAPPAAADKGFARFRSYIPNLMVAVLCEARWYHYPTVQYGTIYLRFCAESSLHLHSMQTHYCVRVCLTVDSKIRRYRSLRKVVESQLGKQLSLLRPPSVCFDLRHLSALGCLPVDKAPVCILLERWNIDNISLAAPRVP